MTLSATMLYVRWVMVCTLIQRRLIYGNMNYVGYCKQNEASPTVNTRWRQCKLKFLLCPQGGENES